MSLLKGSKDNLNFTYQLPLEFDGQLLILDKYIDCLVDGRISYGKTWEFIQHNITINEDLNGKEKTIWKCGILVNEVPCLLGYTKNACQFFIEKVEAFFQEQGVM